MPAFDDGSGSIVEPDAPMKFREIAPVAFGDEDMGGASQMGRRLAQRAPWEDIFISERGLPID